MPMPTLKRRKAGPVLDTGFRRSPADIRDYRFALVAPRTAEPVPTEYMFETARLLLPVYDQDDIPSCVGWTGAGLKTAHERWESKRKVDFDGLSLYAPIALPCDHNVPYGAPCAACGGTSKGGGAYIRDLLKNLVDVGATAVNGRQKPYTISAYAGINPKDHTEVKLGMITSGVLVIGFQVPRSFMQGGGKEFTTETNGPGDQIVGGHAILVIGYDDEGVWLLNSWGETWNGNGRIKVSWAFWDRYVMECWTTIDVTDPDVAAALARRAKMLTLAA